LIAPKNEVSSGFLEDNIVAFYKSLFEGREVVEAHKRHLAPNLELFHCERMLAYMLARYVRDYCTGKGGNKRREQLLTKAVEANYVHNRSDLRRIRRGAKAWTRPSQAMIERFANGFGSKFLMGKPIGFDIDDVMTFTKIVTTAAIHQFRDRAQDHVMLHRSPRRALSLRHKPSRCAPNLPQ
jgi:hypothetical protein